MVFSRTHYLYTGIGENNGNEIEKNSSNIKRTTKDSIHINLSSNQFECFFSIQRSKLVDPLIF